LAKVERRKPPDPSEATAETMMFMGRSVRFVLAIAIVVTIGCDRVTKHVATTTLAGTAGHSFLGDTVRLQYAENTGGFLGLGADLHPGLRTALFTASTGVLLLLMTVAAVRWQVGGAALFGVALFVAGGVSNWIDRLARGSVVDFLNLGVGPVRTGIFNVADVAILAGAAVMLIAELRAARRSP
jgi:signal peptidase II